MCVQYGTVLSSEVGKHVRAPSRMSFCRDDTLATSFPFFPGIAFASFALISYFAMNLAIGQSIETQKDDADEGSSL